MSAGDWDPVMLTIYLNELHAQPPRSTPVSKVRRQYVVDTLVVDLRAEDGAGEEDDGGQPGHGEDQRPKPLDIYAVND